MVPYQGQGANQALEDAEGLNVLLADATERDEIPGLLRIWDSVRRPRASEIQRGSRSSQSKLASKNAAEAISTVRPYTSMKEALALLQENKEVVV
jgi:salicylate hydroxylase